MVELFTSQGCSRPRPAADKIIGELARDPSIVALSMPIDYWDYLGWEDTLADARLAPARKPIRGCAAIAKSTRRKWSSTERCM